MRLLAFRKRLYYDNDRKEKSQNKIIIKRDIKKEKEERVRTVCEYYQKNKPILAINIAREFGINISTVLNYLKCGTKYGYEPYDKGYANECKQKQIRSIGGNQKRRPVFCYDMNLRFIKKYDSITSAATENSVSLDVMRNCCIKEGKLGNYFFKFHDIQSD